MLRPPPRLWLRASLFAMLAAFSALGSASWGSKLGFWLAMAFFLGSYRLARLRDGFFERQMVVLFIPLKRKRWQIERFTQIETMWTQKMQVGWSLVIGAVLWIWWRLFDWILPWLGGQYELRLRHEKGGPVLVWQGNSEANFQANLEALERNTGLPVRRA
ncbi:MAG TPA: hypothetical protein VKU82_15320 [Planctomycetaceae bacterium]|nr:hypothetical protein [Planctomycetaceae bacterium]